MEHTVEKYLQEQQLLKDGERVTVAVSGGADSMALLTVLLQLRQRLHIDVSAAHFNHGLRGEEAKRDEDFVCDWCKKNGVPVTVGHGDARQHAEETGQSLEEAARSLRYAFFEQLQTDKVATAHTANDNAETLLLHLLRGTGPRGMCGIPVQRGRYIRPFLTVSRAEIEQYLSENGICHIEDSTNTQDDCVRNRLRHRVMPELLRENPQFLTAVSRSIQLQTQEDNYLSDLANEAAANCRAEEGYDCAKLRALPKVILHRILLGELRAHAVENPATHYIEALHRLVYTDDPSASVSLPRGLKGVREYALLKFIYTQPKSFPAVTLTIPGRTAVPALDMEISCFVTKNSEKYHKKDEKIILKYDMISRTVCVRPRKSGDTLRLTGGTKTLKKLMIDRKIPAAKRELLPVIEIDGKVVAVDGLGVHCDFLPEPTDTVLVIELQRGQQHDTNATAP